MIRIMNNGTPVIEGSVMKVGNMTFTAKKAINVTTGKSYVVWIDTTDQDSSAKDTQKDTQVSGLEIGLLAVLLAITAFAMAMFIKNLNVFK